MAAVDASTDVKQGMGAIPHRAGVAFRVWAPHATSVSVVGDFNDWMPGKQPMQPEPNGFWYADVSQATIGDEYRYLIQAGDREFSRIDPYAREVTNSKGNGVVHDPDFDWEGDDYRLPGHNEIVIYELHVGTFHRTDDDAPGRFEGILRRLDHLKKLGANVVQIMPAQEFAGDLSWGYNPANIFAVESAYGGPKALKRLVRRLHHEGIGVVLDVVFNHFGPSDLDLWQFDGWSENGGGGIYFYNDWRAETPWGHTRPDFRRGEVRQFLRDNARMWIDDYHIDGLRFDATVYIRTVRGPGDSGTELPDGWSLMQWINRDVRTARPDALLIAEDLQNNAWLTKDEGTGGAGFDSQWDAAFVHPIRAAVIAPVDEARSIAAVASAVTRRYNDDACDRVIYSESHDEVANGKARVPQEIDPHNPESVFAQKRSALAAALVFTSPGIPMLFQGQEFLEGEWFRDTVPVDWDKQEEFSGILRLYRDLIALRRNLGGATKGLVGQFTDVYRVDESKKVIAFHRWYSGGPGDDVIVLANLSNNTYEDFRVGFPSAGAWRLRLNSDSRNYSQDFPSTPSQDATAEALEYDGKSYSAALTIGPYSVLVFSQDA